MSPLCRSFEIVLRRHFQCVVKVDPMRRASDRRGLIRHRR